MVVAACGTSTATDPPAPSSAAPSSTQTAAESTSTTTAPVTAGPAGSGVAQPPEPTTSTSGGNPGSGPDTVAGAYVDIAVVGCSQTRDAMLGYLALTERDTFGDRQEARYLSGGTIERWSTLDVRYWEEFTRWNGAESDALWIQLCWHRTSSRNVGVADVEAIIDEALAVIGREVPVFISGLNDWDPRDMCTRGDYELSWQLAEEAVAAGLGSIGPDPGVLTRDLTDDGCHGNEAGDRFMGQALVDFFG